MNDDGDTVMSELGPEEEPAGKQHTLLIQQMAEEQPLSFPEDDSPGGYDPSSDPTQHADLAPPPLFARKDPPAADEVDPVLGKVGGSEELDDVDQSVATIQGEQQEEAAGERGPYETEADGSPVVGDLLKMQFVEHQVVPTILVSGASHSFTNHPVIRWVTPYHSEAYITHHAFSLGLLLPLPMEQFLA